MIDVKPENKVIKIIKNKHTIDFDKEMVKPEIIIIKDIDKIEEVKGKPKRKVAPRNGKHRNVIVRKNYDI